MMLDRPTSADHYAQHQIPSGRMFRLPFMHTNILMLWQAWARAPAAVGLIM
jgi:hypothetical protein